MPSSIQFTAATVQAKPATTSVYTRPAKRAKMSITQTYFLAHSARGKLSREASRSDHDLRLLVGHANLLDSLMIDLANAEQEQERWFNQSVSGAKEEAPAEQWSETIVEDAEGADDESNYDDDDDDDEEEVIEEILSKAPTTPIIITSTEVDSDGEEEDDDEEDYSDLALTRSPSRQSPPELSLDSESDSSEDEHMPVSPPQPAFHSFTDKEREAIATTSFYDKKDMSLSSTEQDTFVQQGFFLPSRQQPPMIAAY